jgi:hypothetical protein
MTIGDVDSSAFGLLVQWLHTRKLAVDVENALGPGLLRLAKAWVLAERFLMPKIQNAIVRLFSYPLRHFRTGLHWCSELHIVQFEQFSAIAMHSQ